MRFFNSRKDPDPGDDWEADAGSGPDYNPDWHCHGCGCSGYRSDPPCNCDCPCNPNGW